MEDIAVARPLHVLAVVHWIGGVTMVTLVLLPSLMQSVPTADRLAQFERIEGRFGKQARVSTLIVGASGFYMTEKLDAWDRFSDPSLWWMHAMVAVWAIFTIVLFVAEPLFLHCWFHERATRDPEGTFRLVWRLHIVLLGPSLAAAGGAVLRSHGFVF
jgi:uncharacterized membrane protein